jgi:AbrB family looped-hinge helix DNA binding protein
MRVTLREKRQLTLPPEISEGLGLSPGDSVEITLQDGRAIIEPSRKAALNALEELQKAIAESGITEEEWMELGRESDRAAFRRDYPELAKKHGI